MNMLSLENTEVYEGINLNIYKTRYKTDLPRVICFI